MSERYDTDIAGIKVGTCSGGDPADHMCESAYDFEPDQTGIMLGLTACDCLNIDLSQGVLEQFTEKGELQRRLRIKSIQLSEGTIDE